jgi:glycosyltransferase involved in cell wall biosynthesis
MASAGRRPRVAIIVQNLPVPFDRRVWLEATSLQRHGYTVSVICPKGGPFQADYEVLEGVYIHRYGVPVDARGALGFILEFAWCFLRTAGKTVRLSFFGPGFDIIHACNPPDSYWLLALLWRPFGKRFIFDHHDLSPEMYAAKFGRHEGILHRGLLWLEKRAFRSAHAVITTNDSHRRIAMTRGGVSPETVYVVRSGPDLGRFQVSPADAGWKKGARHLLVYLGEMCVQDGVENLVRALRLLRDEFRGDDVHCVFVGGGPHQQQVRQYSEQLGLRDMCTFTGRVDDSTLCRILSSADIAIAPEPKNDWSDRSTMNKIVEYMFFGLPIVCFDLKEHRVSAAEAAVYAIPNDERDLARQVHRLLDDVARREQMGAEGRQRVRTLLAWEHSVPHLLAAYETVTRGSGKSRARLREGSRRSLLSDRGPLSPP